ncbi:MAG: hypothetical protein WC935_07895, partial [Thermoleophilia bacterium]
MSEGFVLGRGLGTPTKGGRYSEAELATEAVTPRKEAIWLADRVDQRAEARFVAESKERELQDYWQRVGATIFGIGVILTFLALGLGGRETRRRVVALEAYNSDIGAPSAPVSGGYGATSMMASSLTACSMGVDDAPDLRPRPVLPADDG